MTTDRSGIHASISYAAVVVLCAILVVGWHQLVLVSAPLALLALPVGAVAWGIAAGAFRSSRLALPAIALIVELIVAFEFKRLYVLDFVGGPPPWSLGVFMHTIFISDFVIAAILTGFGWLGWRWQRRGITASARRAAVEQ